MIEYTYNTCIPTAIYLRNCLRELKLDGTHIRRVRATRSFNFFFVNFLETLNCNYAICGHFRLSFTRFKIFKLINYAFYFFHNQAISFLYARLIRYDAEFANIIYLQHTRSMRY